MFVIQKISQHYNQEQDRIGQTAQNAEGRVLLLWLTQRLVNLLVGTLSSWLEDDLQTSSADQSAFKLNAWEQSSAEAQMKPDLPLDPAAAQAEALVNTINLARSPNGYDLTFRWGAAGVAHLTLTATELRQWLGILHHLFDIAEWPKQAWPEWFSASQKNGAPTTKLPVLH